MTVCCPLYGADDNGPAFYATTCRAARKPTECCECGEIILPKTKYEYVSGKWEGDFSAYKTCLSCVEIRDHFSCSEGWIFTQLWTQLEENFFPTMAAGGPCMDGLSPSAKSRLFDRCLAWKLEANAH